MTSSVTSHCRKVDLLVSKTFWVHSSQTAPSPDLSSLNSVCLSHPLVDPGADVCHSSSDPVSE